MSQVSVQLQVKNMPTSRQVTLLWATLCSVVLVAGSQSSSVYVDKSAYKNIVVEIRDDVPVDNCQTILHNLEVGNATFEVRNKLFRYRFDEISNTSLALNSLVFGYNFLTISHQRFQPKQGFGNKASRGRMGHLVGTRPAACEAT